MPDTNVAAAIPPHVACFVGENGIRLSTTSADKRFALYRDHPTGTMILSAEPAQPCGITMLIHLSAEDHAALSALLAQAGR
jgi:hypothetical protein